MKFALIVGGVVVVAAVLVAVAYFGLIPGVDLASLTGNAPLGADCSFDDMDKYTVFCLISGKTLNLDSTMSFIDLLDIEMCGINGQTRDDVMNYYEGKYADLTSSGVQSYPANNYQVDLQAWQEGSYIHSIAVGDGYNIKSVYGFDTVLLYGHGTQMEYLAFITFLRT